MQKVELEVRDVYGVPKAYPVNDPAKTIAALTGTKTLTHRRLADVARLGFDIVLLNYPGIKWDQYRDSRGQELA